MNSTLVKVLFGCLIFVLSYTSWLYYQTSSLEASNASLQKEIELKDKNYQLELAKVHAALENQNQAIEAYQADLADIQSSITQKAKELSAIYISKREAVMKELAKDCSSDNQLCIIDRILHDFTNK